VSKSCFERIIEELAPSAILDVGCGCGRFTRRMTEHQRRVVAIDVVCQEERWQEIQRASGVRFLCMSATSLAFVDGCFPLVVEREALHHVSRWPDALAEMVRVSNRHVLVEEPIDDLRSEAKRRTLEAQELLLAVQADVGYSHYRHVESDAVNSVLRHLGMKVHAHVSRSDVPRSFDDFFESFGRLAARSSRPAYWADRLDVFRSRVGGESLCEADTLTVLAAKDAS